MDNFSVCHLSAAGTLTTVEGEFTTASIDKTTLLTHDKRATPHAHGLITVTTHRVVWIDGGRKRAISAPLASLPRPSPIDDKSSPLRARVLLKLGKGVRVEFESGSQFKDRDRFVSAVLQAVGTREWERIAEAKAREAAKKENAAEYVSRRVGASGVQDRVAMRNSETRDTINTGFASLDQLRFQAEDLMRIAKAFRSRSAGGGAEENELLSMMAEMGIESPVTKTSAGGNLKVYREQLSRQMSEFLQKPILSVGGIMTVTDAYCLVMRNRATTELVSPEDFRSACEFFRRLRLPIQLVTLESGVAALQLDTSRDQSGSRALRALAEERGSVTAIDVVRIRHVPIQRATYMLKDADAHGFLARDETTEGLRFFPNVFPTFGACLHAGR